MAGEGWLPLGDFQQFAAWSGRARPWGAEGESQAWFGGGVIDGLVDTLDRHLKLERTGRYAGIPAAVGCVPWFTSTAVSTRLRKMNSCVVLGKPEAALTGPAIALQRGGRGIPLEVFSDLQLAAPTVGGDPVVVGPADQLPSCHLVIGPVRVAGYRQRKDWPLLHAKLLVLGTLRVWEDDETFTGDHTVFDPELVWMGSANWTEKSPQHIEVAVATSDSSLATAAFGFIGSLIGFSEPADSRMAFPEPELRDIEFDDEAFAEAAAAFEPEDDEGP